MHGLFMVIDCNHSRGLEHWTDELYARGIPALILVDATMAETSPHRLREISRAGFEIGFAYNQQTLLDLDYGVQWDIISRYAKEFEDCTGKKLNVFGAKCFSYNEATLQIAQTLGVKVLPVQGAGDLEAVVYRPREYALNLMSVSNLTFADMHVNSICDWSIYSRSEAPADFSRALLAMQARRVVVCGQTCLSGIKIRWWHVYQELFNACLVRWQPLAKFTAQPLVLPLAEIPQSRKTPYQDNSQLQLDLDREPGFAIDLLR